MVSFIYQFKKFFGSYEYFITLSWILAYVFVVKINSFQSVYNIFDKTLWRDDSSFDDGFVKYFYSRKWVLFWTKYGEFLFQEYTLVMWITVWVSILTLLMPMFPRILQKQPPKCSIKRYSWIFLQVLGL